MKKKIARYALKTFLLLAMLLCIFQPVADRIAGVVPMLSPFVGLTSGVGARVVSLFSAFCLPILLLVIFRKRWFCSYACPTGLLLELAGKVRVGEAKGHFARFPKIGKWIVFICLGGAAVGYPLMIWMDPLAQLNSFFSLTAAGMAGIIFLVLLSIAVPNLWCGRICPLGATQELLEEVRKPDMVLGRRAFIGIAAGGVIGGSIRTVGGKSDVIRPPGAVDEGRFTGLCSRCGTCSAVCPSGIITPDIGESGIAGFMTPSVSFGKTYCTESCNRCGEVCPTNAIRHISLQEKQNISIGVAKVRKGRCLSWRKREKCMVCADYCPYGAVKYVKQGGVACPEIDDEKCRGCGACELVCPAAKLAIIVKGGRQRVLKPVKVQKVILDRYA